MLFSTKFLVLAIVSTALSLCSCTVLGSSGKKNRPASIQVESFGRTRAGAPAQRFVLDGGGSLRVELTDYGAGVVAIHAPDREDKLADVVLGFDDVLGYQSSANQYFGCTTGRVANRIRAGRFSLHGRDYQLEVNNGPNHLHGGRDGLHTLLWDSQSSTSKDGASVRFQTVSPAGAGGYPGTLALVVTYTLTPEDDLRIDYEARTDAPTPLNLTNHCYFNLAGAGSSTILDHELEIRAARFTPTDESLIPTGSFAGVAGTPLDFRKRERIGARIDALTQTAALGYDHNYMLDRTPRSSGEDEALVSACVLRDPASGRSLEILTTEIGLQFYSGNFLFGQKGKGGAEYAHRSALCLEPQHFPDSVNQPNFPPTVLFPGEVWRSTSVYRFRAR